MSDELTAETRIRIFCEEIDRLNARLRKADEELESAAEQIALLHDEIERLRDQHDTYVEMLEQLTVKP